MKQALILCGGEARRLRPYSHSLPKACMPFLNLPLLSLAWFYMEGLEVSRFLLNAHLFPEKLKSTVDLLSRPQQKVDIYPEKGLLGGAGTLYKLQTKLQKTGSFFYINGDSLFFPSHKNQLSVFEENFLKTGVEGSFFSAPLEEPGPDIGALWCNSDKELKFIGAKKHIPQSLKGALSPFYFSGLALLKSSVLGHLKAGDTHLFEDFVQPLLTSKRFQVFVDEGAQVLEAGEPLAYIQAVQLCLEILFANGKFHSSNFTTEIPEKIRVEIKKVLEEWFARFDPKDQIVGVKNGKKWAEKWGWPLLAPDSVKGLEQLELKGPAVLGPGVHLFGKSLLKNCVLGSQLSWKGELNNDIVLKFHSDA